MADTKVKVKAPWKLLRYKATWEAMMPYAEKLGYEPNKPQLRLHKARARFKVPTWGRRTGKTTACAFESDFVALMGGWVMNVAPTYALADKVWSESVRMIEASPFREFISDLKAQEGKQLLTLKTGGMIRAFSTDNPKSLVGDGWDLCVFDEAALEESPLPWKQAIRAALMDKQGSAIFPSTPRGDNWYHEIFMRGKNPMMPNWWSDQVWSGENPINTPEEIQSIIDEEQMTGDEIQQEIYAQFIGAGGSVFRSYLDVCDAQWQDEPIPGHQYCAGLDLGKSNDFTVLAIWDSTLNCLAHLVKLNLMPYPKMMRKISPILGEWGCPVIADATREEGTVEKLKEDCFFVQVTPFKFSNDSKTRIMNQLAMAFDEFVAHLLNNQTRLGQEMQSEFGAYRLEKLPSGQLRMSAPPGKHDDIVCAVALAYECNIRMMGFGGTVVYNPHPNVPHNMAGTFIPPEEMPMMGVVSAPKPVFRLGMR